MRRHEGVSARTATPQALQRLPAPSLRLIPTFRRGLLVTTLTGDHMGDRARRDPEFRSKCPTGFERRPSGQPGPTRLMPIQNACHIGIAQPARTAHRGFPCGCHGGVPSDAGGLPAPSPPHAAAQPSRPRVARSRARVPPARGLDGENGVIGSLEQAIRPPICPRHSFSAAENAAHSPRFEPKRSPSRARYGAYAAH